MPVLLADSQATLDHGSSLRQASRMASETCTLDNSLSIAFTALLERSRAHLVADLVRVTFSDLHPHHARESQQPPSSSLLDFHVGASVAPISALGGRTDSLVKRKWFSALGEVSSSC